MPKEDSSVHALMFSGTVGTSTTVVGMDDGYSDMDSLDRRYTDKVTCEY